jgi:hypothetical protein
MNLREVSDLVAAAAVLDERVEVEELTIRMWHKAVGHLPYADAEDAVVWHCQRSAYKIRPKDVIDRVNAVQRERLNRCPLPAPALPPAEPDGEDLATRRRQADDFMRQLRRFQGLVKTGQVGGEPGHFLAAVRRDRPVVESPSRRALRAADEPAEAPADGDGGPRLTPVPPAREPAVEAAYAAARKYLAVHLADAQPFMDAAAVKLAEDGGEYDTVELTIKAAELMRSAEAREAS